MGGNRATGLGRMKEVLLPPVGEAAEAKRRRTVGFIVSFFLRFQYGFTDGERVRKSVCLVGEVVDYWWLGLVKPEWCLFGLSCAKRNFGSVKLCEAITVACDALIIQCVCTVRREVRLAECLWEHGIVTGTTILSLMGLMYSQQIRIVSGLFDGS